MSERPRETADLQELIANARFLPRCTAEDPYKDLFEKYVFDPAFIDSLKKQPWFESIVKKAAEDGEFLGSPVINLPEAECEVFISMEEDGKIEVIYDFTSHRWISELKEINTKLFPSSRRDLYSTSSLAKHLGIGPLQEFKVERTFDTAATVDFLGRGLDDNVAELVKLLNEMGLITTGSCGGHAAENGKKERKPYLNFNIYSTEKLVSLLERWKMEGGFTYNLSRYSDRSDTVRIRPTAFATLATLQEDYRRLTDFLREKLHGVQSVETASETYRHRMARVLGKYL